MSEKHDDRAPGELPRGLEPQLEVVHLPGPSYWPLAVAACLVAAAAGTLLHPIVVVVGAVGALASIIAWGLEDSSQ